MYNFARTVLFLASSVQSTATVTEAPYGIITVAYTEGDKWGGGPGHPSDLYVEIGRQSKTNFKNKYGFGGEEHIMK